MKKREVAVMIAMILGFKNENKSENQDRVKGLLLGFIGTLGFWDVNNGEDDEKAALIGEKEGNNEVLQRREGKDFDKIWRLQFSERIILLSNWIIGLAPKRFKVFMMLSPELMKVNCSHPPV